MDCFGCVYCVVTAKWDLWKLNLMLIGNGVVVMRCIYIYAIHLSLYILLSELAVL